MKTTAAMKILAKLDALAETQEQRDLVARLRKTWNFVMSQPILDAPDLDALVARLAEPYPPAPMALCNEAAAALVQLRKEVEQLDKNRAVWHSAKKYEAERANSAEAEVARLTVEYRKVEVLWKEAAIDASRKHDIIGGLENACRISLYLADALQAENRLLRECARTPDLERIDAAIDAARHSICKHEWAPVGLSTSDKWCPKCGEPYVLRSSASTESDPKMGSKP